MMSVWRTVDNAITCMMLEYRWFVKVFWASNPKGSGALAAPGPSMAKCRASMGTSVIELVLTRCGCILYASRWETSSTAVFWRRDAALSRPLNGNSNRVLRLYFIIKLFSKRGTVHYVLHPCPTPDPIIHSLTLYLRLSFLQSSRGSYRPLVHWSLCSICLWGLGPPCPPV